MNIVFFLSQKIGDILAMLCFHFIKMLFLTKKILSDNFNDIPLYMTNDGLFILNDKYM